MNNSRLALTAFVVAFLPAYLHAQEADAGAHLPSQAAADVLRDFTGADGAFLPAAVIKAGASRENLASLLVFPSDNPVVVSLTGAQVRKAIERSISFYPQGSPFFLQLSGFEVTFKKDASASPRIVSLTQNGSKIDDGRKYNVAMPSTLGRGGQGYFMVWDKNQITKTLDKSTMESILKGKRYVDTTPRYTVVD
jgi:5'-nucleotidase/UDP-sugar diphosphatase